jgi:ergothioneine biosynthesis protein EgtB
MDFGCERMTSKREPLGERFERIRQLSLDIIAPLQIEDMVVQSMPDASPTRWHLAHTTWFFEHFVLAEYLPRHRPFRRGWEYLFNSYYYSVGEMHRRPERGLLSRPGVAEILEYRQYVDQEMLALIPGLPSDEQARFRVELGLNHEQQHQELMLTDIKHALSRNPLLPAYRADLGPAPVSAEPQTYQRFEGGVAEFGSEAPPFCFDNESPRHDALLPNFQIASRPVTNAEFRAFVRDGGYGSPDLWLSDGWAWVQQRKIVRPMYWSEDLEAEYSLMGEIALDEHRPVCHLNYYEADAFARWAGARLPTEFEWEHAARNAPVSGNLLELDTLHPGGASDSEPVRRLFGDVWEWTASPYSAYPGFKPLSGSLGEYNGKFMCNQLVLRGGSCVTPADHIRPSYRNFFQPDARWQFSGLRLARDA